MSSKKRNCKIFVFLNTVEEKNAADYVTHVLNMGRANVFKYLRECRDK